MFSKPSLLTRVAVAKLVGFVLTAGTILLLPDLFTAFDWRMQVGFVLWYTSLGACIGLFGVFSFHPMLGLALPWWFRGAWMGGWMNLVLMLLLWDRLVVYQAGLFGPGAILASPWWLVIEGALLGLLMDALATKMGGEGADCVPRP